MFVSLIGLAAATMPAPQAQGAALAQHCADRDGWSDPAPPARIHGTTYYVGTCGISVLLVTSPKGHILIDGATEEAAPLVLANIRALGFNPRDVKLIVGSHEHLDHMGGFAALKAATGARLLLRAPAKRVVESGQIDAADPQAGAIAGMAPVTVDGLVANGGTVRAGAVALTALATPGHTDGGTSWTWRSCDRSGCATIAYVDSLSAVSRDGYHFADHPERIAPFRATFERVAQMPCDILVTPHPSASTLFERLAGRAPLIDRAACARLAGTMRQRLDERLAKERAR
jgi:metallo-beta-lactamase class B